jgi:hypothetical protein
MANPSFFDSMVGQPQKALDTWMDFSRKMMDSFQQADKKLETPRDLFAGWYEKQRSLLEQQARHAGSPDALAQTADTYRQMMETQLEYSRKWLEYNQQHMPELLSASGSKAWSDLMSQNLRPMEQWISMTNELMRERFSPFLPFSSMPRMDQVLNAYQELSRYWEPMLGYIREGAGKMPDLKDWLSPEAYQDMLGRLTGLDLPQALQQAAEHASSMFASYSQWLSTQAGGFSSLFPAGSAPSPMMDLFSQMQAQVEKNFTPFYHLANRGKQGQMLELVREAQNEYIQFAFKSSELQMKMFEAARLALPEALQQMSAQYQADKKTPEFDAFFNLFTSILENYLIGVFETKEYAALQNEVSVSGVKIKNRVDKLMELMFEGAPFTLRSETAELAQEVQELRRKLRTLEKQLEAQQIAPAHPEHPEAEASASETPAPKPRAARAKKSAE